MQIIFSNLFKSFQIFSTLLRDVVTLHCEREKHSAKIWRSLHGNLPKSQLRTSNIEKHETCHEKHSASPYNQTLIFNQKNSSSKNTKNKSHRNHRNHRTEVDGRRESQNTEKEYLTSKNTKETKTRE